MQIKTRYTSHQSEWLSLISLQLTNAGEGVEKREPPPTRCPGTAGGNVNSFNHYGKQYWRYLRKLNVELPYDPAILLLGIYPDKTFIQKDTCTPMFTATLFIIAQDMETT